MFPGRKMSSVPLNRDVDGLISWKSIAEAPKVHNKECTFVRECMDIDVEILKHDAPL